jgi:hypothetical protein
LSGGGNTTNTDSNSSLPQPTTSNQVIQNYHSLPNGTIIHSLAVDSNALGQLKITNGTDSDALVKLVDKHVNSSIFTVFVKARSAYTITHIQDGTYDLLFNTGNDWSEQNSKFLVDSSYSKFRDDFVYATTDTEYATFEVTLNPVVGGKAKTDDISETQFSKL